MNNVVRGALWGVLVTVLLAVVVATWLVRRTPPVLDPSSETRTRNLHTFSKKSLPLC